MLPQAPKGMVTRNNFKNPTHKEELPEMNEIIVII
jgi:hypothetical protein